MKRANTFPIMRPFLMQLLNDEEKAELEQHGCNAAIYPHQECPMGHMITCPEGTRMQSISAEQHWLYLPDGYRCTLLVIKGWYHFLPPTKQSSQ